MDRRSFVKAAAAFGLSASVLPRFALAAKHDGFFVLEAGYGQADLYGAQGKPSNLWLYNGSLPGPEIRARRGERIRVRFTNRLEEPTSVHWHGIRIDNAMDGVSGLTQAAVKQGESFDYDFVAPDAGTYWYHAHNMSWNQVPRGLAGPLIIEESDNPFSPQTDITLFLNDWQLDEEGRLITDTFGSRHDFSHAGRLGNWLTINGQSMPDIPLRRGRWHRLRLINASSARILDLAPDRFGAEIIAFDGQTLGAPRKADGVVKLAPAQRMDLVLKPETNGMLPFEMMTGRPFTFARFAVSDPKTAASPERKTPPLPVAHPLSEPDLKKARTLPLVMQGGAMGGMRELVENENGMSPRALMEAGLFWGFNGMAGMDKDPMFQARRGETIVLETDNKTAFDHAIHLHGHHFRILERNGTAPDHQDWRDTFIAERGERVKIAFVADNPGQWLIHCHMLGHAASGMMTWFDVA